MHKGQHHSSLATQQDHDKSGQHGVLDHSLVGNTAVHTKLCATDADAAHVKPVCFERVTTAQHNFDHQKHLLCMAHDNTGGCKLAFLPTTSGSQRLLCSIAMRWGCRTFSGIHHRSHTPAPCKFAMLAAHWMNSSQHAAQGSDASSALPDASGACSSSVLQQVFVALLKYMAAICVCTSI